MNLWELFTGSIAILLTLIAAIAVVTGVCAGVFLLGRHLWEKLVDYHDDVNRSRKSDR